MYTQILLPVDESIKTNKLITKEGEYMLKNTDSKIEIHALYVKDSQAYYSENTTEKPIKEFNKRTEKWNSKYNVDIVTNVVDGETSSEISRYADRNSIDLIIMAKQSRSKIKEFIYGSTTKKTIKKSDCPVLVINKE